MKAHKRVKTKQVVFCVAYCIVLSALCYGCSPLIRFYSTDSSVFYSIGKAMTQGTVVYRDVFDHKGIWLYFFNYIGAGLDRLLGGYGMSIVEATVYFAIITSVDRILSLFIKKDNCRIILSCLFLGLSLNYFTYQGGNYSETYALAFQMISCALITKYWFGDKVYDGHPPIYMFIHGICSGICLFLRMNLVGIWIPFGIALAIELIKNKKYKNLLINLIALLFGVALATLPVMVYGLTHDCIKDMVFCMFTYNMSYVGDGASVSSFIKELLLQGASAILILCLISAIAIATSKKLPKTFRLMFSVGYIFVLYVTFMGMRAYGHYYQVLIPYTIPIFVFLGIKLENANISTEKTSTFAVLLLACFAITILGNMRAIIKFGPFENEYGYLYDTVQKANEYISADEDKSLLTTSNLMQAYVITDTIPTTKYPYIPGAELPEACEAMFENILSGNYKYIFGTGYENGYWAISSGTQRDEINSFISENYTPISTSDKYTYVMFMRNDDNGGIA